MDDGAERAACHDDTGGDCSSGFEVVRRDGEGWDEDHAHPEAHSEALREEVLVVAVYVCKGEHEQSVDTCEIQLII